MSTRTNQVNKCSENVANEMWLFPLLIQLNTKAIQSRVREQKKIFVVPVSISLVFVSQNKARTVILGEVVPQIAIASQNAGSGVFPLPLSPLSVTRGKNARVTFFPRGFLMRHARRTK